MEKNEIKKETISLYKQLNEENKEKIYTEVYVLNQWIVLHELKKKMNTLHSELASRIHDELYSAITEGLWKGIVTYNPDKGAGLYTYCQPFIANNIAEVVSNTVSGGSMSQYHFRALQKIRNAFNESMMSNDRYVLYEDIQKKTEPYNFSMKLIDSLYPLACSQENLAPIHDVKLSSEGGRMETEKIILEKEAQQILINFAKKLSGIELDAFRVLIDDEIDPKRVTKALTEKGYKKNNASKAITIVRQKMAREYFKITGENTLQSNSITFFKDLEESDPQPVDIETIELFDLSEGKEVTKMPVPKAALEATVDTKIKASIELGVQEFIDKKVKEALNEMSVDDMVDKVKTSLERMCNPE